MGIRLEDYLAGLPAEEREAVAAGAARLIEEEATLRQLREACGLTQEAVGAALGVRPAAVSKVERRADVSVRTLRKHVRAMGGELYLVAKLPGRKPITIKGIG
jgi:DNA-binding XRE family transcriptional regulator